MYNPRDYLYDRFVPGVEPENAGDDSALLFAFQRNELLVTENAGTLKVLQLASELISEEMWVRMQFLGKIDEQHCYSAELAEAAELPSECKLVGLRQMPWPRQWINY